METNANYTAAPNYQISAQRILDLQIKDSNILADTVDSARTSFEEMINNSTNLDLKFYLNFYIKKFDETQSFDWKIMSIIDCAVSVISCQDKEIKQLRNGAKAQIETLLAKLN